MSGAENEVSIVGRAFSILTSFRQTPVLGVSELARMTGIPRSSVHRLANQLVDEGALSRVGTKFRVGATLFELGQLHYPQRLRTILQPLLDDLQRMTGNDVALMELVGLDVIVVAVSNSRRSRATIGHLGQRLAAHRLAGGLLLLAEESDEARELLLSSSRLSALERRRLPQRLKAAKAAGFVLDHGEAEAGRSSIAIPVLNRHRRVLGALMVSGPTDTFDVEASISTLTNFSPTLTAAGRQASIGFFASARPRSHEPASPSTNDPLRTSHG